MSAVADLYRIVALGRVWTVTSADQAVDYESGPLGALERYAPTPMGRGAITLKNELTKANLEVRLPLEHELAVILLSSWVEQIVTITVFRHRAAGTIVIWKGRLAATPPDDTHVRLSFESIYTSLRRPGLRARFLKHCRHPLYGRGCWLDAEDFAQLATLNAINGRTLTVPEADILADGFFTGGMVKAPDGTLTYIASHVGAALELNRVSRSLVLPFAESGPGLAITIYPGCDHSYGTCDTKFANDDNYGGFDHIPTKNPTGGSSIV
jgi:hypothetical protein